MTDLTPKKRAELRRRIQFRRNLEYEQVSLLLDEASALLNSTDERDRLAGALVRAQGPFVCCSHCKEDAIHDVETNAHEIPCTLCQASIGEVEQLRGERDELAAAVQRVRQVCHETHYVRNVPGSLAFEQGRRDALDDVLAILEES